MHIGILGGTFNPIHNGHLTIAAEAKKKFKLDQIIFVPSSQPPHKPSDELVSSRDRFQMCLLATQKQSDFSVSSVELDRGGTSYSIETVKEFLNIYGQDTKLYFIAGADAILDISTWKDVEELFKLCEFILVTRPGFAVEKIDKNIFQHVHFLEIPAIDISSTIIRCQVKEGKSLKNLVPEEVGEYLNRHKLYL